MRAMIAPDGMPIFAFSLHDRRYLPAPTAMLTLADDGAGHVVAGHRGGDGNAENGKGGKGNEDANKHEYSDAPTPARAQAFRFGGCSAR